MCSLGTACAFVGCVLSCWHNNTWLNERIDGWGRGRRQQQASKDSNRQPQPVPHPGNTNRSKPRNPLAKNNAVFCAERESCIVIEARVCPEIKAEGPNQPPCPGTGSSEAMNSSTREAGGVDYASPPQTPAIPNCNYCVICPDSKPKQGVVRADNIAERIYSSFPIGKSYVVSRFTLCFGICALE